MPMRISRMGFLLQTLLSGCIQGQEHTRHPGTCGALMYLQGVTQGEWIPAECLGRNVIACKLGYVHRVSQLTLGCVTCHTCHGCMMDFRPILGNPVEVAHMTSPGTVYISHAKGTYFPLARISPMIPL